MEFTKYIIMEIQTGLDGVVGTIVTAYDDQAQAEQKYHTVLAAAAVSSFACHTAVFLTPDGNVVKSDRYYHNVEEPEEIIP